MKTAKSAYLSAAVLLFIVMTAVYSCGSKANTGGTVSSLSARIVTCPTTTVKSISISSVPDFQPPSVAISVNDIVKWTNNDLTDHTVTSGTPGNLDGKFDSGHIASGSTVCVQFLLAGNYGYFCNIHTFMTGLVTVQ